MDRSVPPLNVSPLIKGARYSFLICGILYGATRRNYILRIESKLKVEEERRELEEKVKKAAIARQKAEEESKTLKEILGE